MIESARSPDPPTASRPAPTGKLRQPRVRLIILAGLLLVLLVVVPPFVNVNHFRRSIIHSVSAGLGRPVHASAVELTLFPRPAFVLHNLTVEEDPAYGAEPVMSSETVTASLRASTLWHRRVEIATLHFDTPSLNLARNAQGHWNFESLLHNSPALHSPGASGSIPRPSFPYIEATEARVNFKLGPEKLPFSLEGADLAVWKESGNEWHVRIRARPVRTDLTVADAGQIRGEGVLKAGGVLVDSPMNANLEWRRVELGEIGRLLHGEDDGWRGTVDWTAQAQGTLAKMFVSSNVAIEEFHRAEFIPPDEMDLTGQCRAQYVRGRRMLDSLQCEAPLGSGQLLLYGGLADGSSSVLRQGDPSASRRDAAAKDLNGTLRRSIPQPHPASLRIALQHAPAGFFLDLLRHIHPGIAEDAAASGEANGEADCEWRGLDTLRRCTGQIRSTPLTLTLPHIERPLKLSPILLAPSGAPKQSRSGLQPQHSPSGNAPARDDEAGTSASWNLAPTHVFLGGVSPATMTGTLDSAGATLRISGVTELAEIAKLATVLKIPAISGQIRSARGSAQLGLSVRSAWLPQTAIPAATDVPGQFVQFAPSRWTGSLQIHNAALKLVSLAGTLQLASAQVNFTPAGVAWNDLKGTFAHISFDGSLRWQTPCPTLSSGCARSFILHTPDLNTSRLQAALHQGLGSSNLLSVINPWSVSSPELPEIFGTVNADKFSVGGISMKNVALRLRLEGRGAQLLAISGDVFGGTLSGGTASIETGVDAGTENPGESAIGSAKWGDGPPAYTLRVTLKNIQPDSFAAIWHEHWGDGSAVAQIDLKTQGWSASEIAQHATGRFDLTWRNGTLATALGGLFPSAAGVTEFQLWNAQGTIRNRTLSLDRSQIFFQSPPQHRRRTAAAQSVTGTVTFGRILSLRFQPSNISITGPFATPVVTPAGKAKPSTQSSDVGTISGTADDPKAF